MDLSSLNPNAGAEPGAWENLRVETRIAFDENNRPVYITVPAPGPVPTGTPQYAPVPYTPLPGAVVPFQALPAVYGPTTPAEPYNPLRDPWVVRLVVGGAAVTGVGFALSAALAALAAATTALGFVLGILALIWVLSSGKSGRDKGVNVRITNTNSSRRWR